MSCEHTRQLLAISRRDELSAAERSSMLTHLSSCADCRRVEEAFNVTGSAIRALPTITPPPSLRADVFARIYAEQRRAAPEVARLSRAATDPALPVARAAAERATGKIIPLAPSRVAAAQRARQVGRALGVRGAFGAVAAALLVGVLIARLLPLMGVVAVGKLATVAPLRLDVQARNAPDQYPLDAQAIAATSALATSAWLVYSARGLSNGPSALLFAEDRKTLHRIALLDAPRIGVIAVRALTTHWVVWTDGDGSSTAPWTLNITRMPSAAGAAGPTVQLLASDAPGDATPTTLGGVWADDTMALVSGSTAAGAGVLLRFDLTAAQFSAPSARVIAHAAAGHLLTDPTAADGHYYWGDVWLDPQSGLHSVVWQGGDHSAAQTISSDEASFHPVVSHGALVWVEMASASLMSLTTATSANINADMEQELLNQLNGSLEARDLRSGQQWSVSGRADETTPQASGSLLLWRTDGHVNAYDLAAHQPISEDARLASALFAGVTNSAVTWTPTSATTLYVYDVAA